MKVKHCWKCGTVVPYQTYEGLKTIPKCTECGTLYPEKPKDEALLTIYQDEWLKNKTDLNFNKFFSLLEKVTFNVIKHKLKSKVSYESLDDIYDKVQWTLEKLVTYYKEKPDFKITTSFVKYISKLVLFPLYNKSEKERRYNEISIYASKYKNSDERNNKELYDYLSQDNDGGVNDVESDLDYVSHQCSLGDKSLEFIGNVVQSIYDYENSDKSFKDSFYILILYKFFVSGLSDDSLVRKIMNSLDYSLVKKFEESKELYKNLLIEYSRGK